MFYVYEWYVINTNEIFYKALHYHIHNHTNRFQVEYCDKDK